MKYGSLVRAPARRYNARHVFEGKTIDILGVGGCHGMLAMIMYVARTSVLKGTRPPLDPTPLQPRSLVSNRSALNVRQVDCLRIPYGVTY